MQDESLFVKILVHLPVFALSSELLLLKRDFVQCLSASSRWKKMALLFTHNRVNVSRVQSVNKISFSSNVDDKSVNILKL